MSGLSGSTLAYLPARSGLERSAACRSNYYAKFGTKNTTNVVVTLNGVDVSAYVLAGSLTVSHVINDQPDTASFSLKPTIPTIPQAQQLVSISLGDVSNIELSGQILRLGRRYVRGVTKPYIDVDVIDYSRLFDRRVVTQHWSGVSATQIASDIVDGWTSGFTRSGVAAGLPTIDDFSATNETPTSLLRRLVNLIDGAFRFNGRDVVVFGVAGDTTPKAGTNPLPLTISPVLHSFKGDQFTYESDVSQIRTRSIVEGKSTTCPVSTPSGASSVVINATTPVDYLIVAGGGGGGALLNGGGGAGGLVSGTDTIGTSSLAIVVGGGGTGGASATNGADSSFNGHTATGGGHGSISGIPASGGSGGGASNTNAGAAGVAGQGNNGGNGDFTLSAAGGGGGGAGAVGGNGGPNAGGPGGIGIASAISGVSTYYAGGGTGNGNSSSGGGGLGGGGGNSVGTGLPGAANTGGGGGAGSGGANGGGSGIVILSYPIGAISATGGTMTQAGGRQIHTFTTNGTFVVSTVTLTAPAPVVTDIPLNDASQIDVNPGVVRIGSSIFPYLSTAGPVVAAGANPPGSALSADAAMFATSISVTSASSIFTASPGWAKVGDQIVRYTGVGATTLTGIPALGFGSLAAAVKSGTSVTWLGSLVLSVAGVSFSPPLAAGDAVVQRVIVESTSAEATVAALEGGDGVHEQPVSDGRLSVAGATSRANAELADFSTPINSASWDTEDLNARPGRQQTIAIDTIAVTLTITKSDVSFPTPNGLPRRTCEASTVHTAALLDAVVTSSN